ALQMAPRAVAIEAGNSEAALLRDDLIRQLREQRSLAAAARIEDLAAKGDYEGAIAAIAALDPEMARDPAFSTLRVRVTTARDQAARRRRAIDFQLGVAGARHLLA